MTTETTTSGVTEADVYRIVREALGDVLRAIAAETRDWTREQVATLEATFAITLADTLAASEAVRRTAGSADLIAKVDELARAVANVAEKNASLERRVSRHAEHLQKIEDRRNR